jgi:hypothetical protein
MLRHTTLPRAHKGSARFSRALAPLPKEPISFVASNGRLYLSLGTEVDVMAASGEIFWVDPFSQALSGTAPTLVQAACVP